MQIENLTKQYDGKTVVDSVTFKIPQGKVISMIGPNGAGKSTVLNIISRLIARDSGLVEFEGQDISRWKSKELAKRLAILTQSNNIQMKLTVRELVSFGRFPYSGNHPTKEDQEMIDKAIRYMELEEFEDRFIDELSGGQLGKRVILVLHEINYAAFYSDYVCAFVDGKIAKFGTVEEVMTKENLAQIYKVDFEIMRIQGKPLSIYY